MTVKEHLKDVHEKLAGHHISAAKSHRALAKCFGTMEKTAGVESAEDIAEAHEGLAEQHISMSEFHIGCCKDLSSTSKAMGMGMDDGDRIRPDGISSIAEEAPQHIRAISRHGSPELDPMGKVAPGLEKVLEFDEG